MGLVRFMFLLFLPNTLSLVLSGKKNSERNKKPYPPLQVKWSVPYHLQQGGDYVRGLTYHIDCLQQSGDYVRGLTYHIDCLQQGGYYVRGLTYHIDCLQQGGDYVRGLTYHIDCLQQGGDYVGGLTYIENISI